MSIKTLTLPGYLRDIKSKEIITEVLVHMSIILPPAPNAQSRIKGSLMIQNFKPEYNDRQFFLELSKEITGRVRTTMQPMSGGDIDLINTEYDIRFEDSIWSSNIGWFESL